MPAQSPPGRKSSTSNRLVDSQSIWTKFWEPVTVNNVDPSGSDYIDLSLNIDLGIGLQAGLQIGDNGVVAPYVGAGVGLGGGLSGGVFSGEPSSGWTANVQACYGGCLGVSESEPSGADQLYWGFGTDAGISGTIDYTF